MKKIISFITLLSIMLTSFTCLFSCEDGGNTDDTDVSSDTVDTEAIPMKITLPDGTMALVSDGYRLDFKKTDAGYGIYVIDASADDVVIFKNDMPAIISVRTEEKSAGVFDTDEITAAYDSVTENEDGYLAAATVRTESGSEFLVSDSYRILETGAFAVTRNVSVTSASGDVGFRSIYSLCDPEGAKTPKQHDFFIPSILYKNEEDMVSNAIGSNLSVQRVYVKETRTGLPMAMLRARMTGYSIAIAHLDPEIDVAGQVGGGSHGEVNAALQYGSIGYKIRDGLSVDFCYPSLECPTVYYSSGNVMGIYHPVEVGAGHEYSLSIIPAKEETYADSMTYTFQKAYLSESPEVTDKVDLESIYNDNIEIFTRTLRTYGTGDVIAAGVPWSIDLARGFATEYSFQMGFVGQQTSVGYNLMRAGYKNGNAEMIEQGNAIIDFWTSDTIMKDKLPIVWWDPRNSDTAGQSRGYPSFIRCVVDGMEGILDAYKIAYENGNDNEQWKKALIKVADFFVDNQNEDGSYYRCYFTNGKVCTDTTNSAYQGTSKLNTPVTIRFLAKMYEFTGDERYKTSAIGAAEYSYEVLYKKHEKYVGGTPDNPNTVDKEAAIYAMYGFNAVYALTGDEKYLAAAEHAATSAMSWVYCYDFACPGPDDTNDINPFTEGGRTSGFSIIATGHSGADNYAASMYYEMFKLYIFTGNEFYLEASKLLGFNTKLSSDYDGTMDWRFKAMGPEATNISDFNFSTVGVWLPWSGIVNIKPIGYMEDTFGNCDVRSLTLDLETLRSQLEAYGIGGKIN